MYKNVGMNFVSKGWGYERWITNTEKYCGKLLFFVKGKKCSWHHHRIKEEHFYVKSGKLKVWWSFDDIKPIEGENYDNKGIEILEPGDNFHVPVGMRHQMLGLLDTEMFEFSTQHFDEDSYRIEKGD